MKRCCTCKRHLSAADFNKNAGKGSRDGLQNQCRSCQREAKLKHRYSLSSAAVSIMMEKQQNRCTICGNELIRPCVDHNHSTGDVRGILCQSCNVILGLAREDEATLQAAIEYLRVKR